MDAEPGAPILRFNEWPTDLIASIYSFFKEEAHCDVELAFRSDEGELEDQTLPCHSVILNASSNYFEQSRKGERN